MIRNLLSNKRPAEEPNGREKRNCEIQRIETFSDGVLAFAITLLIVSLEVPKSFEELIVNIRGFYAFAIGFCLLAFIWHEQHKFFRQYGLSDTLTVSLNLVLLFVILFYVYPLKFLFTLLFSHQIYGSNSPLRIADNEGPVLMEVYAVGYIIIYALFLAMYWHALSKSSELELDEGEIFDCKTSVYKQVVMVAVGCLSLIAAILVAPRYLWISGFMYALIGPGLGVLLSARGRARRRRFHAPLPG